MPKKESPIMGAPEAGRAPDKSKAPLAEKREDENRLPQRTIELFDRKTMRWEDIRDDILEIENQSFGERAFTEEEFKEWFASPEDVVVLLRDQGTRKIIGYTYAFPEEGEESTAHISSTAILPEFRGRGLVGELVGRLEDELRKRGFRYIARDASIENKYADAIARHYGDRIVVERDQDSEWGPQRYFKIKL